MLCIAFLKGRPLMKETDIKKSFLTNSKVNSKVFLCKTRASGLSFRKTVFKILVFVFNEIVSSYAFKKFTV